MYKRQIIKIINLNKQFCIFSYDQQQCLRRQEERNNIEEKLSVVASPKKFKLTDKIRTNKEIADFIRALFNLKISIKKVKRPSIRLHYFQNYDDARAYIELQGELGWKTINYTHDGYKTHPYHNCQTNADDNAHSVIGQEFDNVIGVIDSYFCYDENKKLSICNYSKKPYYAPVLMLFQILTRTRKRLSIIVINNPEIMKRCLSALE